VQEAIYKVEEASAQLKYMTQIARQTNESWKVSYYTFLLVSL